jgi:hypothetical protein
MNGPSRDVTAVDGQWRLFSKPQQKLRSLRVLEQGVQELPELARKAVNAAMFAAPPAHAPTLTRQAPRSTRLVRAPFGARAALVAAVGLVAVLTLLSQRDAARGSASPPDREHQPSRAAPDDGAFSDPRRRRPRRTSERSRWRARTRGYRGSGGAARREKSRARCEVSAREARAGRRWFAGSHGASSSRKRAPPALPLAERAGAPAVVALGPSPARACAAMMQACLSPGTAERPIVVVEKPKDRQSSRRFPLNSASLGRRKVLPACRSGRAPFVALLESARDGL